MALDRLTIFKTGSTYEDLAARDGDYEHRIARRMGVPMERVRTIRVAEGEPLPELGEIAAAVVTGSSAMVTDREPWSVALGELLVKVVDEGVPLLAICYGHQLLADALGGHVAYNPRGREIGTVQIDLSTDGARDPLFRGSAFPVELQSTHMQSVVELPPRARLLASTALDPNAAFAAGERAWAVQLHPELDAATIREYVVRRADRIRAEGGDPEAILGAIHDTPHGEAVLRRFAELAG